MPVGNHVEPRRITQWNSELGVQVVKGIGFWWKCAAGCQSPTFRTYREARDDMLLHQVSCHREREQ